MLKTFKGVHLDITVSSYAIWEGTIEFSGIPVVASKQANVRQKLFSVR